MKEIGRMMLETERDLRDIQTETCIMVDLKTERHMEREFTLGITARYMMENGIKG